MPTPPSTRIVKNRTSNKRLYNELSSKTLCLRYVLRPRSQVADYNISTNYRNHPQPNLSHYNYTSLVATTKDCQTTSTYNTTLQYQNPSHWHFGEITRSTKYPVNFKENPLLDLSFQCFTNTRNTAPFLITNEHYSKDLKQFYDCDKQQTAKILSNKPFITKVFKHISALSSRISQ